MLLALIRGGVPVLSRDSLNPNVSSDFASPIEASSPIRPAGRTSRPRMVQSYLEFLSLEH